MDVGIESGAVIVCDGAADQHGHCEACGAPVESSGGECRRVYGGVDAAREAVRQMREAWERKP